MRLDDNSAAALLALQHGARSSERNDSDDSRAAARQGRYTFARSSRSPIVSVKGRTDK